MYVKVKIFKDSLCYFIWSRHIFCNMWNSCHMSSAVPHCSAGLVVRTVYCWQRESLGSVSCRLGWGTVGSLKLDCHFLLCSFILVMGLSAIPKIQFSALWNCLKALGTSNVQAWERCWTSVGMLAKAVPSLLGRSSAVPQMCAGASPLRFGSTCLLRVIHRQWTYLSCESFPLEMAKLATTLCKIKAYVYFMGLPAAQSIYWEVATEIKQVPISSLSLFTSRQWRGRN